MAVILPPGSTSVDLQAAVDSAASADVIILSSDMPFTNTVTVPVGKELTIQSDTGNNWVMSQSTSNTRHFVVAASLILQNITLDGSSVGGGVLVNNAGSLTMGDASIVQNCTTSIFNGFGGGIVARAGSKLTMNSTAIVRNCIATSYGGGIYLNGSSFTMGDKATIDNCSAATGNDRYGGGVYLNNSSTFTMNGDAVIQNCTANHGAGVYLDNSSFTMGGNALIQSCAASYYTMNSMGGGVAVFNNGNFIMNDKAAIKDCTSVFRGGGISLQNSTNIIINGESTIDNCTAPFGGGIQSSSSGIKISGGAVIQNCKADDYGGGIRLASSTLIMEDSATIKDCTAATRGGGLFLNVASTLTMRGNAVIKDCTADNNGGGILLIQNSSIDMTGGVISGNHANNDGGGIYILAGTLKINSAGYIVDNNAINGNGGGIFTADTTYANLLIASDTVFNRNRASAAYVPPPDAPVLYPNIEFASVSIKDHPLNNFDINYVGIEPATFNVFYNANGGTGSYKGPDISLDETDTVLSPQETRISRTGYRFVAWNTQPDASGTSYAPKDIITITNDITLYAQWREEREYLVTYDCNGGSGRYVDHCREFDVNYKVLSPQKTKISRTGYSFVVWNTQPDGSGSSYAPSNIITVANDITLYAQWREDLEYLVTYDCNGGIGSYVDHCRKMDLTYTVLSTMQTGISYTGYTFTVWNAEPDGSGISYATGQIINVGSNMILYAQWRQFPQQKKLCRAPATKCRRVLEGQKIWVDNDNAGGTRPPSVEILLLRDGEVYKRTNVDSAGDGYFGFCCIPVWKNSGQKYNYQINETAVVGYTITIEGYNVINTLNS